MQPQQTIDKQGQATFNISTYPTKSNGMYCIALLYVLIVLLFQRVLIPFIAIISRFLVFQ